MKNPESPRAYPAPSAEPLSAEARDEKIVPRYVNAPALREHGLGPRNLVWGVALLILALILLVVAMFLAGSKAMVSVATCLLTFTALFVLARLHVFRQRNGGFLALGMICLIGAAIPLAEIGFTSAKGLVASRGNASQPVVTLHSVEAPAAAAPALTSLPAKPQLAPDPTAVAKSAGAAPANPAAAAKLTAKSPTSDEAELAELTRAAQQEAMRRYPALAIKDSLENAMFVSTYKQLRDAGSDNFFANPEWPLELADLLAGREGWVRGGAPITTGPAPVLDPPDDAPPKATLPPTKFPPSNLPPVNSLDAGSDLPRSNRPLR